MHLAAVQLWKRGQCAAAILVRQAQHGEGHQHLVSMQSGVVPMQQTHLGVLYGFNNLLGYQFHAVVNASQMLRCVKQQRCAGAEQGTAVSCDDGAVRQLYGRGFGVL